MPVFDGLHVDRPGQSSSVQQTREHLRSSGSQNRESQSRSSPHAVPSAWPPLPGGVQNLS